ncbi:hypothetical protein SAMN02745857_00933 [Andreprevotia lacus DSM 23236]|jgi:PBP1b-binding outer membrane lipoprotein LpoB|uniref:Uncharacterized protein n=1 Tax=Andreprevotia lacus DSM 23236 TaxID=1121001 RepID=A0A1W1X9P2_9NEIS|nr:hypothetical protein [Andreprevotia lacus]SMC20388.1 hypothetical protein SAMN02745857_00933 [Andreprevotia lacus DSM 23236]
MKRILIAAATALLLAACSNPHDVVIPKDMSQWDSTLKSATEKLPDEEKKLLAGYLVRTKLAEAFSGKTSDDKVTIGEAIEAQRKWMDAQKK